MFGIPDNEAMARTKAVAYKASNVYELKNGEFDKVSCIKRFNPMVININIILL